MAWDNVSSYTYILSECNMFKGLNVLFNTYICDFCEKKIT